MTLKKKAHHLMGPSLHLDIFHPGKSTSSLSLPLSLCLPLSLSPSSVVAHSVAGELPQSRLTPNFRRAPSFQTATSCPNSSNFMAVQMPQASLLASNRAPLSYPPAPYAVNGDPSPSGKYSFFLGYPVAAQFANWVF